MEDTITPTTAPSPAIPQKEWELPHVKYCTSKWKKLVFCFAIFASMSTVARNAELPQWSPEYLSNLTNWDAGRIGRQIQETLGKTTDGEKPSSTTLRKRSSRHEALQRLTRSEEAVTCPSRLRPVEMVSNTEADVGFGRRIPKIVHITGKTKCLTDPFYHATKLWQFENHSFYFHDDRAVNELLGRDWPMFPQLKNTMACLKGAGGAALADLWRYLALYEYGGIYTDMDNHPNTQFNATSVPPETDAYFLQEGGGWLSQYFFAISPKHPLMFLAVHDVMQAMHNMLDTGNFYVPSTTGPGALKRAFLHFMGLNGTNVDEIAAKYSKPTRGHYLGVGFGNHSVTVFSNRRTGGDYLVRTAVGGNQKMEGWRRMNITNYQAINKEPNGKTCIRVLHEHYSAMAEAETDVLQTIYRRQRW